MQPFSIRPATPADARSLLAIYAYYVKHTAISFEYEVPTEDDFRARIERTSRRYPYLVAEQGGQVLGYAYAGQIGVRAAYDWSCEVTIYLDRSATKQGIGRALYEELERRLKEMGIVNLYACVARPDEDNEVLSCNSADFHAHMGYAEVGRWHHCGYKLGQWCNIVWLEKIIGEHRHPQPPVSFQRL